MARASRNSLLPRLLWRGLHFALLFGVYLLFAGEVSRAELIAAAVIAALGFTAWRLVKEYPFAGLLGDVRAFGQGIRLFVSVFSGTWEVLSVLLAQLVLRRPADSLVRAVPFDAGGDDDRSTTRRALAVAYTSITPNFIVLDVDRAAGRILFHQIKRTEVREMTKRLGAGG